MLWVISYFCILLISNLKSGIQIYYHHINFIRIYFVAHQAYHVHALSVRLWVPSVSPGMWSFDSSWMPRLRVFWANVHPHRDINLLLKFFLAATLDSFLFEETHHHSVREIFWILFTFCLFPLSRRFSPSRICHAGSLCRCTSQLTICIITFLFLIDRCFNRKFNINKACL